MSQIWKILAAMLAGAVASTAVSGALISKDTRARSLNRKIEKLKDKSKKTLSICDDIIVKHQELETYTEDEVIQYDDGKFENYLHRKNLQSINWDTSKDKIDRLSPIISELPTAGITAHLYGRKYMIVEAHSHLSKAKDGFGFRAIIHGSDGKIVSQAKLHPSNLGKLLKPALIFNAVSFIVAQKHLHDISDKLEKMSIEVKKISDFQQNDRLSGLIGDYNYLTNFVERVKIAPENMESKSGVIEEINRKTFSVYEHLIRDIKNETINPENIFYSRDSIIKINELVNQILLCIKIRLKCFILLEIISPNPNNISNLFDDLRNEIIAIPQVLSTKFDHIYNRELSYFNNLDNAGIITKEIESLFENLEENFNDISSYFNDFCRNSYSISNQKEKILLKMDGQRIVGVSDI